jgi:hypothetical protein
MLHHSHTFNENQYVSIMWASYHWRNRERNSYPLGLSKGRNSEETFSLWISLGLFCLCAACSPAIHHSCHSSLGCTFFYGYLAVLSSIASTCYDAQTTLPGNTAQLLQIRECCHELSSCGGLHGVGVEMQR